MSKTVVLTAAAVCLVAALLSGRFLVRDHDLVASTPSPPAVFKTSLAGIPAGRRLCLTDVTIPADARQIRFQVDTGGVPGPALTAELSAPGYQAAVPIPAGYADGALIAEALQPPAKDVLGEVCIRNPTQRGLALVGTAEERTLSRPEGVVDGRVLAADAYLAFFEDRDASALRETPSIIERMGAFRPGVVGPWLLWPLLALTVVGVPLGLLAALLRAARA